MTQGATDLGRAAVLLRQLLLKADYRPCPAAPASACSDIDDCLNEEVNLQGGLKS